MKLNLSSVSIALSVLLCLSSCENTNTPINGGKSSEEDKNVEENSKERPMMALEYVTEFNIGETSKGYAATQNNDQSGFYTWKDAKTACPDGTHLPSQKEWRGIVADYPNLDLVTEGTKENVSEEVEVHGTSATYTADYFNTGKGITYALRFKDDGNTMLAAYRYEMVGQFANDDLKSHLQVTARYLGPKFKGDIKVISTEEFWSKENTKDVVRMFPASGMMAKDSKKVAYVGMFGFYWSSTKSGEVSSIGERAVYFNFSEASTDVTSDNGIENKFSVRPFKD